MAVGLVDELANDADLGMGLEHLELERGRAVGQQRRCRSILAGRDVRHGFADCGEGGGAARVCGTTEGARARLHCEGLGGPRRRDVAELHAGDVDRDVQGVARRIHLGHEFEMLRAEEEVGRAQKGR